MTSGARQIGSYELLRRIHLSHTAEVFEARPRYGGERVAIKRLLPHALEDPSIRTRFEREIEMATSHDHPGLVRGLEVIAGPAAEGASGDPCLVMALVEGTPLIELLDTRAPIEVPTEDALMHLAHTVATHLLALHEHPDGPMAHGDISGKNIIARADGDFVLLDLGSMAPIGAEPTDAGTDRYLCPARRQGGAMTTSGDIYGLGVILWELTTGVRRPASTSVTEEPEAAAQNTTPFGGLIARCLAPDPAQRPTNATAFLAELGDLTSEREAGRSQWRRWCHHELETATTQQGVLAWVTVLATITIAMWTAAWFIGQLV